MYFCILFVDDSKPVIMWSLYFKREFYSDVTVDRSVIPENVIVIPGPGPEIDIDCVVDQVKLYYIIKKLTKF